MGGLTGKLSGVIGGFIVALIGIILTDPVVDTVNGISGLDSFSGADSLMNLVPTMWVVGVLGAAIGVAYITFKSAK